MNTSVSKDQENPSEMELSIVAERLRAGDEPKFPENANTLEYAEGLDNNDSLRHLRDQFILPTKASLKKKILDGSIPGTPHEDSLAKK